MPAILPWLISQRGRLCVSAGLNLLEIGRSGSAVTSCPSSTSMDSQRRSSSVRPSKINGLRGARSLASNLRAMHFHTGQKATLWHRRPHCAQRWLAAGSSLEQGERAVAQELRPTSMMSLVQRVQPFFRGASQMSGSRQPDRALKRRLRVACACSPAILRAAPAASAPLTLPPPPAGCSVRHGDNLLANQFGAAGGACTAPARLNPAAAGRSPASTPTGSAHKNGWPARRRRSDAHTGGLPPRCRTRGSTRRRPGSPPS